jgi:hypothetical protein
MTNSQKKDVARANELMRHYANAQQSKKDFDERHANELAAYKKTMDDSEKELLEIAERNKDLFEDDNWLLENGYVHEATNSVVETTKKFNWPDFLEQKGDLVKINFETAKVKKAWLDTAQHNELIALGVQVNTTKKLEVKVNKKPA